MSFFNKKWLSGLIVVLITTIAVYGWIFFTSRAYERFEQREQAELTKSQEEPVLSPVQTQESALMQESGYPYLAKLHEEQIGIFDRGGQLLEEIPIEPAMLRDIDLAELEQGIPLVDEAAYIQFLESFAE